MLTYQSGLVCVTSSTHSRLFHFYVESMKARLLLLLLNCITDSLIHTCAGKYDSCPNYKHYNKDNTLLTDILRPTTHLAAVVCVCQCAKFDQFLPARSHFDSKRPENFVRIAKFPYAAFGPLFAFHCPLFFTRNNDLECKSSRFAAVVRRSMADKQLA